MKIKLIAIAPADGWAFVSQGEDTFQLRPPYTEKNLVRVSKDIAEKAIFHHGFESCEISFNNMTELVDYIKTRFVEIAKAHNKEVPSSEQLREILEFATDDVLDMFLTRTENELIPQKAFGPARAIATDLLRLDSVINDPKLYQRALDILEICEFADIFPLAVLAEISEADADTSEQLREALFVLESTHDIEAKIDESALPISPNAVGFLFELKRHAPAFLRVLEEEAA